MYLQVIAEHEGHRPAVEWWEADTLVGHWCQPSDGTIMLLPLAGAAGIGPDTAGYSHAAITATRMIERCREQAAGRNPAPILSRDSGAKIQP